MHALSISLCALRFVAIIAKPLGHLNEDFQGPFDSISLDSSSYNSAFSDSSDQNSIFFDSTEDLPLDQDISGYSTEFFPSNEPGFPLELADNSNIISSCQAQGSTSDMFKSDILQARGLNDETSNLFQEASNNNGSPTTCTNPATRGSQNNNNNQNNQSPPDQEPKGAGLLDINSKPDEDLCPTGLDGIKQAPLCCWSVRNAIGSSKKYACFTVQENNNLNCQYWFYQYCCKIYDENELVGEDCTQGFQDGSFRIPVILPIFPPTSQD